MANTLRGSGLFRADRTLAALVEDPDRLDRARSRFSESPPSYRSHFSHNSTLSQSPNPPPSEGQRRREERKWQLINEHRASYPHDQFMAESREEYRRLFKPVPGSGCVGDGRLDDIASELVKKHWIEQGIWNEEWESTRKLCMASWKHEEPLELESESETDSEAEFEDPIFCLPSARVKPRRPKSAEELRRIAERRVVRERQREASRPFYQFTYQVSKERERIQDEMNPPEFSSHFNQFLYGQIHREALLRALAELEGGGRTQRESNTQGATMTTPHDINTTAYERVKSAWMKRGIWNRKWGVMPGMSWKHEQLQEEMLREEMGDDALTPVQSNRPERDRYGAGEAPAGPIFGPLFPAESNHEAAGVLNASRQEPPVAIISGAPGSDSHGAGGAPPRRNLFTPRSPVESSHDPVPVESNHDPVPVDSSHDPVPRGLNASPLELAAIDPVGLPNGDASYSSAALNSRRRPRRRPTASELPSEAPRDAPVPPRRSRRLEQAGREAVAEPSGVAAAGPHDGGSPSRPRRISAGPKPAGPAKPQGVSKRRRPNTTRPRAR